MKEGQNQSLKLKKKTAQYTFHKIKDSLTKVKTKLTKH